MVGARNVSSVDCQHSVCIMVLIPKSYLDLRSLKQPVPILARRLLNSAFKDLAFWYSAFPSARVHGTDAFGRL